MNRYLPPLGAVRAFEAAARLASFKRAAAELGVTPTAISHQIRQLEQGIGQPLFVRETRKVVLTQAGRSLLPALTQSFETMAAAFAALRQPVRQAATLSATVAFTAKLLVPRAGTFAAANPGWDLRLHASDEPVDFRSGEADAAIRYGLGRYPGLHTQPLLADHFAPICSPHLGLTRPQDLKTATLLHFEWGPQTTKVSIPSWRAWAEKSGDVAIDTASGITFNDENAAIQAAIAGQGVALLSVALVAAELTSGALVQPFGPILPGLRYDLVYSQGSENRPAIAALRRWIETEVMPHLPA